MIRLFGERSLLVELDGWRAARALATSLAADPIAGVEAVVPGLTSVLLELDAEAVRRFEEITAAVRRRAADPIALPSGGRTRTIPVAYGGAHGPDLESVAAACGLPPAELVARHRGAEVRVLFCGFAPGFAYLGELPDELRVPRLATPRTSTPAGSVAIAGSMTGIYPADLPGGWPVIGRTPLLLFDPHREPPGYLAPGDVVRWEPVDGAVWPAEPVAAEDW